MTDDTYPTVPEDFDPATDGYAVLVGVGGKVMGIGGMPESIATALLARMSEADDRPPGALLDCCRDADAVDRGMALAMRTAPAADADDDDDATPLDRLGGLAADVIGGAAAALARRLGKG